ncbi:MAG TPA: CoA-binding protein, partial [Stellaceae bacterium]|nr:CoA-binding protein [Stellaceae bacterium]
MSLDRFLNPRAIAIIGASPETGKIRGLLLSMLKSNGYEGALYPINPGHDEIAGLRCWPSVAAVEKPIDLALIAIPAEGVPAALEECAAAGIPYAAIISSGFAEQGGVGDRLQAAIAAIVRRTGIRVCGPNAEGFHNEIARVAATFSPTVELKPGVIPWNAGGGRVGVIAQSGGMGFSFYNRGRALGLAFSQIISTGNEVD